jgi:hypothetical protein
MIWLFSSLGVFFIGFIIVFGIAINWLFSPAEVRTSDEPIEVDDGSYKTFPVDLDGFVSNYTTINESNVEMDDIVVEDNEVVFNYDPDNRITFIGELNDDGSLRFVKLIDELTQDPDDLLIHYENIYTSLELDSNEEVTDILSASSDNIENGEELSHVFDADGYQVSLSFDGVDGHDGGVVVSILGN